MNKIILIVLIILLTVSVAFALTVGKITGFDYGIIVGGNTGFPGSGDYTPTPPSTDALLLEDGDYLLLENDDKLLLE